MIERESTRERSIPAPIRDISAIRDIAHDTLFNLHSPSTLDLPETHD